MKINKLSKKNLIAVSLVAFLAIGSFGVYTAKAASAITENESTITITVPEELRDDYSGQIDAKLYKVADVLSNGEYSNEIKSGLVSDLSSYSGENSAELSSQVADAAAEYITCMNENERAAIKSYDVTIASASSETAVKVENGLYLLYFDSAYVEGSESGYTFTPSLITAPMNYYVEGADKSTDEWVYSFGVELKYSMEPVYGSLLIDKTLTTFNTSLSGAAFVYTVDAYRGDKLVYSNAVSMDFTKSGSSQVEVKNIPANTRVVVTEKYTGASYTLTSDATQTIESLPSDFAVNNGTPEAEVAFSNNYDEHLNTGSIATVNTVTYDGESNSFGLSVIGGSSENYDYTPSAQTEEAGN